jgi:hypothetical protein
MALRNIAFAPSLLSAKGQFCARGGNLGQRVLAKGLSADNFQSKPLRDSSRVRSLTRMGSDKFRIAAGFAMPVTFARKLALQEVTICI